LDLNIKKLSKRVYSQRSKVNECLLVLLDEFYAEKYAWNISFVFQDIFLQLKSWNSFFILKFLLDLVFNFWTKQCRIVSNYNIKKNSYRKCWLIYIWYKVVNLNLIAFIIKEDAIDFFHPEVFSPTHCTSNISFLRLETKIFKQYM